MARRASGGRRSRKRRRSDLPGRGRGSATQDASGAGVRPQDGERPQPSPYTRSEQRNEAVRASLEPLREGQRPRAVTIAAIVALLLAAGNLIAYFAGVEVDGERPSPLSLALPALLLLAAWGMWRARYWAVLGMQAVLALVLIGFSLNLLFAVTSDDFLVAAVSLAVLAGAGTLFWFMVKAMARIQLPERR